MSTTAVRIDARYNGPPSSGHGGYSAGLVGTRLGGAAETTLKAPPPLERELALSTTGDEVVLLDGDREIAIARPTVVDLDPAPVVDAARIRSAIPSREQVRSFHPFPTCFGCGPDREPGDGLCLFSGEIDADARIWGTTWTPEGEPGDAVDPLLVWAAMDCPSSAPSMDPTGARPMVLGRLALDLRMAVPAAAEHMILTAPLSQDGRKHVNAVWLVDSGGRELAVGRATWIELRPQDAAVRRGDGR